MVAGRPLTLGQAPQVSSSHYRGRSRGPGSLTASDFGSCWPISQCLGRRRHFDPFFPAVPPCLNADPFYPSLPVPSLQMVRMAREAPPQALALLQDSTMTPAMGSGRA